MLLILVFFPMIAAALAYVAGRQNKDLRDNLVILFCAAELVLSAVCVFLAACGRDLTASIPGFCGFGLTFRLDGFRAMYALIGGVMWTMCAMLSKEYFSRHYRNRNRYYFFYLMTLGATVGVFLSADLYTTFIFFEIMSFTSYTWVAHDETPLAMRSAETYLAVAVIGGMVMLFGLFCLKLEVGTLVIADLYEAAQQAERSKLLVPAVCILLGFGAKAGMFPLHIWLPKAHPVAPAPASALLSGILTKTGIYGIIVVTLEIFRGDPAFANLVLLLGVITMFLGALLGVFSINLKRTLACSSMSQIGFILTGIACSSLLGAHNALAARGTVLYMLNHSLFKLILFMSAGVVYMNLHKLDLNDIRGFGRHKPLLHFAFLMGMFGLMGIPYFSGYVSKTLIHEGIVELAELMAEEGLRSSALVYTVVEWIFLLSGGLTGAYMLKLYICIFWERHPLYQMAYDDVAFPMSRLSSFALFVSAVLVPLLGVRPSLTMDPVADLMAGMTHQGHLGDAVDYFSLTNLKGALISISIGLVVYFGLIRPLLTRKTADGRVYINAWPEKLDLEERIYKPLIAGLTRAGHAIAALGSEPVLEQRIFKPLIRAVTLIGFVPARLLGTVTDAVAALLTRTVLRESHQNAYSEHVGNTLVYAAGSAADAAAEGLNRTIYRKDPREHHFVGRLAGIWDGARDVRQRATHTMSYALLMFGLGLCATLIYLIFIKG
ncbi:MAG: sodium:proton antiporter [Clostridia bacterium]|nr:sodium:proton antiporter [Clostridia bacterium]